jgi:hypothetical protein
VSNALIKWRKRGKHLPAFMRDFHDQKDVFKTMHRMYQPKADDIIKAPTWIEGHTYVIDWFLWFMAYHGYTLQKSRAALPFEDIHASIKKHEDTWPLPPAPTEASRGEE